MIWDNRERFGGGMLYAGIPWDYRGQVVNKRYFSLRLAVWYNKANSESEVIAVQNFDSVAGKFQELRYFNKTLIQGFTWDVSV